MMLHRTLAAAPDRPTIVGARALRVPVHHRLFSHTRHNRCGSATRRCGVGDGDV